jgi:hypothetical protein
VTPVWAGRLWSLYKNGKPLFYDSKVMQPTNDALRQAYVEVSSHLHLSVIRTPTHTPISLPAHPTFA